MLVELVILFALHADDKNEAEQLFRKMETKLASAKSLECTFKLEFDPAGGKGEGSLALADGNKSRVEATCEDDGKKKTSFALISDGEKTVWSQDGSATKVPTPKWLNDRYRASLPRAGVVTSLGVVLAPLNPNAEQPKIKEFKAEDEVKVSDFEFFRRKEKVGDQEAQVVLYKLHIKAVKEPLLVLVWIDVKTNLPLKRSINGTGDDRWCVLETYTKWTIDEKIDPKKFEVPKVED